MKINNIGYLLKEGIRGIFLHGFMSFAAVCVTVACLMIVGSFMSLIYNLNIIVEDLNKTNEVVAYVDENLSDAEARSVGTSINRIENVYSAEFVSREEALENFIADIRKEFSQYAPEDGIAFVDAYIAANPAYWVYYESVNQGKLEVAQRSSMNALVDTITAGLTCSTEPEGDPDMAHYDSMSQIKLGHLFGQQIAKFLD